MQLTIKEKRYSHNDLGRQSDIEENPLKRTLKMVKKKRKPPNTKIGPTRLTL